MTLHHGTVIITRKAAFYRQYFYMNITSRLKLRNHQDLRHSSNLSHIGETWESLPLLMVSLKIFGNMTWDFSTVFLIRLRSIQKRQGVLVYKVTISRAYILASLCSSESPSWPQPHANSCLHASTKPLLLGPCPWHSVVPCIHPIDKSVFCRSPSIMPSTLNTINSTFGAAFIGLVCSAVYVSIYIPFVNCKL